MREHSTATPSRSAAGIRVVTTISPRFYGCSSGALPCATLNDANLMATSRTVNLDGNPAIIAITPLLAMKRMEGQR